MSSTLLQVVRVIRLGIFGLVSLFSIIVLGLGAHILSVLVPINGVVSFPIGFAALGLVVSLLTLFSLIPMLVLSFLEKVLWVNMVAVEVGWLGFLWILWLATAALTNNDLSFVVFSGCGFADTAYNCGEVLGFQALAWLNWVLLFKYTIVLIALTVFQHIRGNRVWTAPVHQVNFFAPPAYPAGGAPGSVVYDQKTGQYPAPQLPQQYPPQQPQQYPPQQPQQYTPQLPEQPGQAGYPPPAPGVNYTTTTYQTPPPANPGYQV